MEVFFYEKILSIQNHSQAKTTQQKQKQANKKQQGNGFFALKNF